MLLKSNPDVPIYSFDESRFGTKSQLGHGWFSKGTRPRVKVKLGFKSFYVYSAVHSNNGDSFSLIMPSVNTECMNVFLENLALKLKGRKIFLLMDGAAWHKSKALTVPDNIQIILLPPYSPELNPVERLWRYIKNSVIKNKIYSSLDQLEEALCAFIPNMTDTIVKNISSIDYLPN